MNVYNTTTKKLFYLLVVAAAALVEQLAAGQSCRLSAEIECLTSMGLPCKQIRDPRGASCSNGERPNIITFRYTGAKCGAGAGTGNLRGNGETVECVDENGGPSPQWNQVYVEVWSDVLLFSRGVVNVDEVFKVQGKYRWNAIIRVYQLQADGRTAGRLVQTVTFPTRCETGSQDLRLGTQVGSVGIVGFNNVAGSPTLEETVTVNYYVTNVGAAAVLRSSVVTSAFREGGGGAMEAIYDPQQMSGGQVTYVVYTETVSFDLAEKYRVGAPYRFGLVASATQNSGGQCTASESYWF